MGMLNGWGKEGDSGMNWENGIETYTLSSVQLSSVTQSCLTLRPHGLQLTRPPCSYKLQSM